MGHVRVQAELQCFSGKDFPSHGNALQTAKKREALEVALTKWN